MGCIITRVLIFTKEADFLRFLDHLHHPEKYFRVLLKWGALGILMGLIGGLLGTAFAHTLQFVTDLRTANPWLIFLLPIGGLAIIGLYRSFKMSGNRGANEIIDAILQHRPVKGATAPVIFLSTAITHLLGGSAGREGAALQLGGSAASAFAKGLHLKEEERTILIMSGMSAVFSALFGTPLTATFFIMEFEAVGTIFFPALLPCYLAAFTASRFSAAFGVHAEVFPMETALSFNAMTGVHILLLSVGISLLGIAMCLLFHKADDLARRKLPNTFLRIAAGGLILLAMTMAVGSQRYNGAGMDMAMAAMAGHANCYDFLLKLLFTAITLAAGFKGGEIVPTFCIGATFGCVLGDLVGMDTGFAAAFGLIGLFCAVTNSPISAILLSVEMFGSTNLPLFAVVCVIVFVLSGNWGLYSSQIIQFSKARLVRKEHREEQNPKW